MTDRTSAGTSPMPSALPGKLVRHGKARRRLPQLAQTASEHARHLHLGDADAVRDVVLGEILAEAQQNDLGVASAERAEQWGEHGSVLGSRVAVVDAAGQVA